MKVILISVLAIVFISDIAFSADCSKDQEGPYCQGLELESLRDQMRLYYEASVQLNQNDEPVVSKLMESQDQWESYTASYCGALYNKARFSAHSGAEHLDCQKALVKQRTYHLWHDFLKNSGEYQREFPEPEYRAG